MIVLFLRLLLAFLAFRWLFRRLFPAGPAPAPSTRFDPRGGPDGGKARASEPSLSPHPIEDAEFEDLPKG